MSEYLGFKGQHSFTLLGELQIILSKTGFQHRVGSVSCLMVVPISHILGNFFQRFSLASVTLKEEGSSQARYFVSRLIPAHKDPPYEQEARFPQMHTLTPEQRAKLKSCFFHVDDLSFCEWMRSMKLVPPEPS